MNENLNSTPSANRVQIGIYGRRNVGKSSLINALTGQELSIVSPQAGTTTDPVFKTMELLPLGPVVFIDTAGIDDEGEIGLARVNKTKKTLQSADLALLVLEGNASLGEPEQALLKSFQEYNITYLIVRNKADQHTPAAPASQHEIWVSSITGENIRALRERIAKLAPPIKPPAPIIGDMLTPGDLVILVIPIDSAAPKGRIILPQQQTIRDILDTGAQALVAGEAGLAQTLKNLVSKPRMVVTDSQVFQEVAQIIPEDIPLTSFSMLLARHKGILRQTVQGAQAIDGLENGDTILISEGCTHHRQCDDIGTVKLPRWLQEHTGKTFQFAFSSGGDFPDNLDQYKLVIHCGACMITQRTMEARLRTAEAQKTPITNFGIAIAKLKGILPRSLEPFEGYLT